MCESSCFALKSIHEFTVTINKGKRGADSEMARTQSKPRILLTEGVRRRSWGGGGVLKTVEMSLVSILVYLLAGLLKPLVLKP